MCSRLFSRRHDQIADQDILYQDLKIKLGDLTTRKLSLMLDLRVQRTAVSSTSERYTLAVFSVGRLPTIRPERTVNNALLEQIKIFCLSIGQSERPSVWPPVGPVVRLLHMRMLFIEQAARITSIVGRCSPQGFWNCAHDRVCAELQFFLFVSSVPSSIRSSQLLTSQP